MHETQVLNTRQELLRKWHQQASGWAADEAKVWLRSNGGPATAGTIMDHLDAIAAPAGYEVMRHDYLKRYHFVRRLLNQMVRTGALSTATVTNSRGRESTAYLLPASVVHETPRGSKRRKRVTAQYDILVQGGDDTVRARLEEFLAEHDIGDGKPFEAFIVKK